jgi:hypothetical protein
MLADGKNPSQLEQTLAVISQTLADPAFAPDPARSDWNLQRTSVQQLKDQLDGVLAALAAPGLREDAAALIKLQPHAVSVATEVAALLAAMRRDSEAQTLLRRAEEMAHADDRDICRAARESLPDFVTLSYAIWLTRHERNREAERLLRPLVRRCQNPIIVRQARWLLEVPRPITSAPSLFTINGIGFRLWGARDRGSDGSYTTTWGLVVLFIPLLPLAAYRVKQSGKGYLFLGKVALGGFARLVRNGLLASALVAVAGLGGYSWWTGESHHLRQALSAAQALESKHGYDEAAVAYERVARDHDGKAGAEALRPAGEGLVRAGLSALPGKLDARGVDGAARLVRRYLALPEAARSREASLALADGLTARTQSPATPGEIESSLRLLDLAHELGPEAAARVATPRSQLRQKRIAALATVRPLDALALAVDAIDDRAGLAAAAPALRELQTSPSLLLEGQPDVEAYLKAVGEAEAQKLVAVKQALEAALRWRQDAARQKALDDGDGPALARRAAAHPDDQEVVLSLAVAEFNQGAVAAAAARVHALGAPGHTIAKAQLFTASVLERTGKLAEAAAILEPVVAARLPRFQRAAQAYKEARNARGKALWSQLEEGDLPKELAALHDDKDKQLEAARAWVVERLDGDWKLTALKQTYERHGAVVAPAMTLGRIELAQASEAAGAARAALLAESERLFLAIADEAEGQPGYHLALGQVYHRLGRPHDGDVELGKLADGDDEWQLRVAEVYRDLGLLAKARVLTAKIYAQSRDQDTRYGAAQLRSHLADTNEEKQTWLERADQKNVGVALALKDLRAERALLDGHDAEAARLFGETAARREREAAHDPTMANNASVAYQNRYRASGDPKDLERATRLLESAYRAEPQVAQVALNVAAQVDFAGQVRVLGKLAPVERLRPTSEQAELLLTELLAGRRRDEVRAALRAEPLLGRALQVARQGEVLAPQWPEMYEAEANVLDLLGDQEAQVALDARLVAQPPLDTAASEHAMERYLAGELDAEQRRESEAELKRIDNTIAAARRAKDGRTEGFAQLLRGDNFYSRAFETGGTIADLVEAEKSDRAALALVPELSPRSLGWTLVGQALLRAGETSPEMAKFLKESRRRYTLDKLLLALREGKEGAARVAALRARPELAAATKLLREDALHEPSLSLLVVARVAGDEALAAREAAALTRPDALATMRTRQRIRGQRAWMREFVDGGGK